jgi:YegS/Rv2252/BmrU family lipid kinase
MTTLKTFLVVNPQSANGRTGKAFPEIGAAVRNAIGDFDHAFTTRGGEATTLARDAIRRGYQRIVAVGGDGTVNEVVNGFFDGDKVIDPEAVFALIPRGTGGDFRKTFGWSPELHDAAARLRDPKIVPVDVGRLHYTAHDGSAGTRYFINIASCGISGVVDQEVNAASKALGGTLSFKLASLKALLKYSDKNITLSVDDGPQENLRITCLAVGNGQYFGSGMWVCPSAQPDDGIFDITVWSGFSLGDFIFKSKAIYEGSHVRFPGTRQLKGKKVRAESSHEVVLDVDGETPGRLPATWELVPGAIKINR